MEDKDIEKSIEGFLATEKVYHYTSFEAACKIIASQRLKFGVSNRTNDINEAYRTLCVTVKVGQDAVMNEKSKYKQLCFTKDNSPRRGYDISAMWGHYAKKGYGTCLVFDKSKIMSRLSPDMVEHDVEYIEKFDEKLPLEEDIQSFFKNDKEDIFFKKTNDWSYEQEWRILVRSEQQATYLPFGDSLMAIIMYVVPDMDCNQRVFNSENVELLKKLAPEIPILNYALWFGRPVLVDREGIDWSEPGKWKIDIDWL